MAGRNATEVGAPPLRNISIPAGSLPTVALANTLDAADSFVPRALEHLRGVNGFGGLPAEFQADPAALKSSGGGVAVHLQQQFKSIPIFLMSQTVRFKPDGSLQDSTGTAVTLDRDLPVEPYLTVQKAVLAAAQHVGELGQGLLGEADDFGEALTGANVDLASFQPKILAAFLDIPCRPIVLEAGPFSHAIKAQLTWFPDAAGLLLGWEIILSMPQGAGQYRVIVDAKSGKILYSKQLIDLLTVRGSVYAVDGTARASVPFPRPWSDYAVAFDPTALPAGVPPEPASWIDDATLDTAGICATAHLDDSGPVLKGKMNGGSLVFEPDVVDGDDQKILNMFYFNSFLHDVFYLLGFREEDGNFQLRGVGGVSGDPVDARAFSGPVWGTANMFTPPDGTSPTMNMGLLASTGRHTAFDATVVFHEYMHGVTNRLVGGPTNTRALEVPQSKAMGEGWGDYVACTLTGTTVVGQWVANKPSGIRSHPYDDQYPGTFGQLGQGVYTEAHRAGEIWCATLMAINRNLNLRFGSPRGQRLALQLVVDALKLSPANPNMLDMRDAILLALDHKVTASPGLSAADGAAAKTGVWAAFAKYGMGVKARSPSGDLTGVVEDFTPGTAAPGGVQPSPTTDGPSNPAAQPSAAAGPVSLRDTERTVIPDNDPKGVSRLLHVASAGSIQTVTLRLTVRHAYPGDLSIKLVPPQGSAIPLYNQEFSDKPDLEVTYTQADKLARLVGTGGQGDWVLQVSDLSPGEVGAIQGWSLEINAGAGGAAANGAAQAPPPSAFTATAAVWSAGTEAVTPLLQRLMHMISLGKAAA